MLLISHTTTVVANIPVKPPMPINIVIEVNSKGLLVMGKEVATQDDIENSLTKTFAAVPYVSESYANGVLKFSQLDKVSLSEKCKKKSKPLVTEGTMEFTLIPSPPAIDPVSKAADPNSEYKVTIELKAIQAKSGSK
ncbi:hypothetical protein [Agarilytica rhodophyticola]|uniref:hypothetical protein n=1 Tax=Agarilytica rhodophyticola TaxID=1737490 RepID=UPI000B345938|nr:hypothetical protein [Agarilytica rhodophyticola]